MGVGIVVTGKPTWCNGSTVTRNVRDVGSSLTLGTVFLIFITPKILVTVIIILYKLHTVLLLNLPGICIWKTISCMYAIVSIKRLRGPSVVVYTEL